MHDFPLPHLDMPGLGQGSGPGNIGMLFVKVSFSFIKFSVKRNFPNNPISPPSDCELVLLLFVQDKFTRRRRIRSPNIP